MSGVANFPFAKGPGRDSTQITVLLCVDYILTCFTYSHSQNLYQLLRQGIHISTLLSFMLLCQYYLVKVNRVYN